MAVPSRRALLDNALKRQKELIRELEALSTFIAEYEKLGEDQDILDEPDDHPGLFGAPSQRLEHSERVSEMIDAARRIIIGEKRPMQRGELRERVESMLGIKVTGKDKNKVFGTNLWRSEQFITVGGRGYWPKDVELPSEFR